jgi:hypothetical protein
MYSALFLEYEAGQRTQDLRRSLERALWMEALAKKRSEGCRSRLARKLVTLGLRIDPQAASSALHMEPVGR